MKYLAILCLKLAKIAVYVCMIALYRNWKALWTLILIKNSMPALYLFNLTIVWTTYLHEQATIFSEF
jgi:hypothetical protein